MIEMHAARIINAQADEVTIAIDKTVIDAWRVLCHDKNVVKSRQMSVRLSKPRRPRTTGYRSQNHHLNGHIAQICQFTKDSFDDVKMYIKRESISADYPFHTTSFGDVEPQSEADASTAECAILIETAHRIASDFDIKLKEFEE